MSKASNVKIVLNPDVDRQVVATWDWDEEHTAEYQIRWWYTNSLGISFLGNDSSIEPTAKNSSFTIPDGATKVWFHVKPISETYTKKKKEVSYWTADWSTAVNYYTSSIPPNKPNTPGVDIEGFKLTASLNNIDATAKKIQFQIVRDDATVVKTATATITTSYAEYVYTVAAGHEYKVRCRAERDGLYSEWSEYSISKGTIPAASGGITICRAKTETSVYLEWKAVSNAKTYEIEYAKQKDYFDNSNQTTTQGDIKNAHYEVTGLETGSEYFFRVRAKNEEGESAWSGIKSTVVGKVPSAPTTWSLTTTVITGEPLTLSWMHNAEDGSSQTYAQVRLIINGSTSIKTIDSTNEKDDEKTMHYDVDTKGYPEGTQIKWAVRTAGVYEDANGNKQFGEWSIERTVDVYSPATLDLIVTDVDGEPLDNLTSFPLYLTATPGPNTQSPISYHVVIVSNGSYETTDNTGFVKTVKAGDEVYSNHFDTTDDLTLEISAGHVNLENNVSYTAMCTVSMNSGLTATDTANFTVAWTDEEYEPNAEIGIDEENLSAFIRPYCRGQNGDLVDGITLSVYRREFDGSFTEIGTGIANTEGVFVTDPHPALDYARYRVVAISDATGAVSYYDVPPYPVGESAIIIQWDEDWSYFDADGDDVPAEPNWSGSLLKLPYNIDVSDSHEADVSLVKYIGRKHPVTYYGTQLGVKSDWSVEIERTDVETLYALRRLAVWMGDVYVREPSGSGYWANISVSFSQKHCEVTIPVNLSITRVSGGV